jgi:VanZ family protein
MNVFEISDKICHFAAFFAGAVPLFCAFRWTFPKAASRAVLLTIGYIAIYGAIDETHQLFTVNRSGADIYDWTADALGGAAGAMATAFLYARFTSPHRTAPERD